MKYFFVALAFTVTMIMPLQSIVAADSSGSTTHWLLPACVDDGKCNTCDFIQLMVNLGQGSVPVLALFSVFMFVFGGFWWLISGGDTERINRGKQIMIGAVIGLVLALMSYIIVTFTISALSGKDMKDVKIFNQEWNEFSCPS